MKRLALLSVLSLLMTTFVRAEEPDSARLLTDVVVSAKYLSPVSVSGQTMSIRSIPQSVSVVNPVRIKEMNITTIDQAMQQVTGVTTIANDNMRSQYKSRGYNMSIMTDGLPAYNSLALSQQFDLSFFEQIEVLRGVSGILQGVPDGLALGGVINLVKKRAGKEFGINVLGSVGSWNNLRGELDINAPLTKDGKLRSRWVLFLNNREFFYDRSDMRKEGAYGVIEWDATASTQLSLSYTYQYSKGNVLYNGLPAWREDSNDPSRNSLPVKRSFNPTPDWDYTLWKTQELMFKVEQKIGKDWKVAAKAGAKWQEQENKYGFAGTVSASDSTSNYQRGYNDEELPRFAAAMDVTGRFRMLDQTQNLFVGINYENFVDDKRYLSAYYKTKFGNTFLVPDFEVPYNMLNKSKMRVRQGGIYAQLRLALLDNLNVTLGGRMSSVFASMYDFNGKKWVEAISDECRITPYAGITYDPIEPVTLYASYSTIFVPQTEKKEDGSMLDPREGYQMEIGAKSEFFNNRLTANVALFYMKDDGRAYKVAPTNYYVNGGRVENKGFEVEINAFPCKGLELSAGYTYLDTEITKSSNGDEGLAFSPVEPKHSFRGSAVYRFEEGLLNGLAVGANVMSFSESYASVLTPERKQEAYTLLNGFVSYKVNANLSLFLNCNNITDCVYYSRVGGNGDFFGDPRNFTLSARCSF